MDSHLGCDNVVIIDFMNYLHRCKVGKLDDEYAMVYVFFKNLRYTVEQFSPDKLFFALEGHPKHRYEIDAGYKANRQLIKLGTVGAETPDEPYRTAEIIQTLLGYLPTTLVRHHDFEADDLISSLCENMKDEALTVLSNDSDYIQLLQRGYNSCQVYNPIKKTFMEAPKENFIAVRSLCGDKSDNIKGLVSAAKAKKLVNDPKLFAEFMAVEENHANFNVNRQLIEFHDVPMEEIDVQEGEKDWDALKKEFEHMQFESITNEKSWAKFCGTFECLRY